MRHLVLGLLVIGLAPAGQSIDMAAALATARRAVVLAVPAAEGRDIESVYARASGGPVWLDEAGALTDRARAGLALIERAFADGLTPDDYGASGLAALAQSIASAADGEQSRAASFDVALTAAVLRYYRHVHLGRVDPVLLGLQIEPQVDGHDFAEVLWGAVSGGRVAETAGELAPPIEQYRALKSALARYRAMLPEMPEVPVVAGTVRAGDAFGEVAALRRVLTVLGDRSADAPATTGAVYDDATRLAVERFQARHGLAVDGVIGGATAAALRVPLAWRIRQMELGLERLRWLPDLGRGRLIAINIPMFMLWAWNSVPSADSPAISMAVVVGRALDARTPVFAGRLQYVVFRPYWNVPPSIALSEILPAVRRDPAYLERGHFEIVRGSTDDAPVVSPGPETIAELEAGRLRLRQRPGPANALGLVKFMLPNRNDVYIHATPATELFGRARRDFSHGCIRVEDPVGLARWVLGRDATWTRNQVEEAMRGADNTRVDVAEPVQVVFFYTTAAVVPDTGAVHFAADLYGQDAELDRALAGRLR